MHVINVLKYSTLMNGLSQLILTANFNLMGRGLGRVESVGRVHRSLVYHGANLYLITKVICFFFLTEKAS